MGHISHKVKAARMIREERRAKVAELHARGYTLRGIAEQVGVSHVTVLRDQQALRQEWQDNRLEHFGSAVKLVVEGLIRIVRESGEAFERSRKPTKRTRKAERTGGKDGGAEETSVELLYTAGDARFLAEQTKAMDHLAKITGAYAPGQLELSGRGGVPLTLQQILIAAEGAGQAEVIDAEWVEGRVAQLPGPDSGNGEAIKEGEDDVSGEGHD